MMLRCDGIPRLVHELRIVLDHAAPCGERPIAPHNRRSEVQILPRKPNVDNALPGNPRRAFPAFSVRKTSGEEELRASDVRRLVLRARVRRGAAQLRRRCEERTSIGTVTSVGVEDDLVEGFVADEHGVVCCCGTGVVPGSIAGSTALLHR